MFVLSNRVNIWRKFTVEYFLASGYDIRYTYDDPTSLIDNFNGCNKIVQTDLILGDLNNPAPAGELEEWIIKTPNLPTYENGTVYSYSRLAFSIKAFDSAANYGDPSNAAVINFFIEPVIVPTATSNMSTTEEPTSISSTTEEPTSMSFTTDDPETDGKLETNPPGSEGNTTIFYALSA